MRATRKVEVQLHINRHLQITLKHGEQVFAARAAFNAERDAKAVASGFGTYDQMASVICRGEYLGPFLPAFELSDRIPPAPHPCPCCVCKLRAEEQEQAEMERKKRKRAEYEHAVGEAYSKHSIQNMSIQNMILQIWIQL